MPSYISNSKSKRGVIIFSLSGLLLFLISNFLIYRHFYLSTTKDYYINNMSSKEKHMALNLKNAPQKDAVFIGNSRTLYHISTLAMRAQGIDIYNLGISGHETSDFPSMVDHTLRYHPKSIVLCLAAAYFHGKLSIPRDVDLDDLAAYVKSGQPFSYTAKALAQYFKHLFLVNTYSTNINLRVRAAYQAFDPQKFHFNLQHIKQGFKNPLFVGNKAFQFDKRYVKCKIFRLAYPKKLRATGMCTNGDGILAGNNIAQFATRKNSLENTDHRKINKEKIQLFNYILAKVKRHAVKPIVIFTPVFQNSYSSKYLKETAKAIKAPVIDLTNTASNNSLWADRGHLNEKGRYVYTQIVAQHLKPFLIDNHTRKQALEHH